MTSIGVLLPVEEEEEIVQLRIFSSKGEMMYKQGDEVAELCATELDKMRDTKFTRQCKLPATRMYFLEMQMSEMTCSAGEGGSYLHCLPADWEGRSPSCLCDSRERQSNYVPHFQS